MGVAWLFVCTKKTLPRSQGLVRDPLSNKVKNKYGSHPRLNYVFKIYLLSLKRWASYLGWRWGTWKFISMRQNSMSKQLSGESIWMHARKCKHSSAFCRQQQTGRQVLFLLWGSVVCALDEDRDKSVSWLCIFQVGRTWQNNLKLICLRWIICKMDTIMALFRSVLWR